MLPTYVASRERGGGRGGHTCRPEMINVDTGALDKYLNHLSTKLDFQAHESWFMFAEAQFGCFNS
jgi:hypothetical protein